MYQFKYQAINPFDFYPPIELTFTCIVPANWLSLDLPTMSGCVNYTDCLANIAPCGVVVFEFCEQGSSDEMLRIFSLDIVHDGEKFFETPIVIHVPNSVQSEVLMLNHLFGFNAISAWVAVDFSDLKTLLKASSTYYLSYGVGKSPAEILPNILQPVADGDVKSKFLMIFGDNKNMRLEYLDKAMDAMTSSSTDECLGMVCAAGVEQDEMLISILVGC